MDQQTLMKLVETTHHTRHRINRALRDIDRRALNAMILVKRHGNALAGYGVIASAFRDQAARMQEQAEKLQQRVTPLVEAFMQWLKHAQYIQLVDAMFKKNNPAEAGRLKANLAEWQKTIEEEQRRIQIILHRLLDDVARFEEAVSEQEYVVTNGRIEAALAEGTGAPLTRVSREMGAAVREVRETIEQWKTTLEEFSHESRADL